MRRDPSALERAEAAERGAALHVANHYRRLLGLPPLRLEERLCAAATAHSRYLVANRANGHFQVPDAPGFTGVAPSDRARAAGYERRPGQLFESIAEGVGGGRSVTEAVKGLFDAPYHRRLFTAPGQPDLGVGVTAINPRTKRVVLDVGGRTDAQHVVLYPVDGQKNVPPSWQNNERPDPLRMHTKNRLVGYPITLFYGVGMPGRDDIRVTQATLATEDGRPVPCFVNTPDNDAHLSSGVFLIPQRRLRPDTTYVATVDARTRPGFLRPERSLSRRWRFTTGSARD